jgi:hypothetical protein
MIFHDLKNGIHLEKSNLFIAWNSSIDCLKSKFNPEVITANGKLVLIWKDESLLDGITGNWEIAWFQYEIQKTFHSISLDFSGDKKSFEAYEKLKLHLSDRLGKPTKNEESTDEKETRWEHEGYYVFLYLFEMHEYKCILTIGQN